MGPFSAIMDAISVAGKVADNADVTSMARALNNTKSITERARKSIFVYPVLFSSGMADLDTDFNISKFLELQYGIFTLMTVGLNPSVENGDIAQYLNSISAESVDSVSLSFKTVNPNDVKSWYDMFSEENKDFFEEYKYSMEAKGGNNNNINKRLDTLENDHADIMNNQQILSDQNEEILKSQNKNNRRFDDINSSLRKLNEDREKKYDVVANPYDQTDETIYLNDKDMKLDSKLENLEKKLGNAAPTMITLNLKIKGYDSTFTVPIALKASPHFLKSSDLAALFDSAVEDRRLLTRIVKLTSGEISFFKDFMFNMDRIKRDQKLYETFGQHPWYQQFMARKEKNRAKRIGIIASALSNKGKDIVSATSNYLPTASIIMTVDELERSSKMKYGFLLKNEKIMWDILQHLGLLCIGVLDSENDIMTFYFNGFKKPLLIRTKDMSKGSKDPNEKMVDLMTMMMKRGVM